MQPKTALIAAGIGIGIVAILGYMIGHTAIKLSAQIRTTNLADQLGD